MWWLSAPFAANLGTLITESHVDRLGGFVAETTFLLADQPRADLLRPARWARIQVAVAFDVEQDAWVQHVCRVWEEFGSIDQKGFRSTIDNSPIPTMSTGHGRPTSLTLPNLSRRRGWRCDRWRRRRWNLRGRLG